MFDFSFTLRSRIFQVFLFLETLKYTYTFYYLKLKLVMFLFTRLPILLGMRLMIPSNFLIWAKKDWFRFVPYRFQPLDFCPAMLLTLFPPNHIQVYLLCFYQAIFRIFQFNFLLILHLPLYFSMLLWLCPILAAKFYYLLKIKFAPPHGLSFHPP